MADEVIGITFRTRRGRQAAGDARQVSSAIGGIGRAARTSAAGVGALGRETRQIGSRGLGMLRNQAQYAGFAIGGIGALAIRSGLQFNASMEQNQIAFTQFLGSAQAARQEMDTLFQIARKTPFELADVTMSARQLLAYGFPLKQANSLLLTLGDAAAGAGVGAEGISRMVLAMGQIRGKGTLQMEELRQLQEMGVINMDDLAKNLGITKAELGDVGKQSIPASKAIRAIQKSLDDTFGGQSQKQAKSFTGQLSTLRDDLNQTMGVLTKPLFNSLRKNVFPAVDSLIVKLREIWSGDATGEMKIFMSRRAIRNRMRPLIEGAGDAIGDMHIGRLLAEQVEAGTPVLLNAAADVGPKMAGALITGWWHSGKWTKLATVGLLAFKLASFVAKGAAMGRGFRLGWGTGVGTLPAPVGAPTSVGPGRGPKKAPKAPKNVGRLGRAARGVGRGLPFVAEAIAVAEGVNALAPKPGESGNPEGVRAHGPRVRRGTSWWEHTHPDPGPATNRTRAARRAATVVPGVSHIHVNVDGKEVARAVHRHANDAKANRRGG